LYGLNFPHIHGSNAYHFSPQSCRRNIPSHPLGFLDISPNDACIGAKVNESTHLRTANASGSPSAKDNLVLYI
jgi:hypothetical protein